MSVFQVLFLLSIILGLGSAKPQYGPEPPAHMPPEAKVYNDDNVAAQAEASKVPESVAQFEPGVKVMTPGPVPPPKTTAAPPVKPKPATVKTAPKTVETKKADKAPEPEAAATKFKYNDCDTDTLFVIDSTSSVRDIFEKHRSYAGNVIKELNIAPEASHVGVIVYSSRYRQKVKISLTDPQDKTNISGRVNALPFFSGVTATGQALELALTELKNRRPNVPTNLVVITDGFSYDLIEEPVKQLHAMSNLRMFAVALSETCRDFEMLMIAGSKENLFNGEDSYKQLLERLQQCDEKSVVEGNPTKKSVSNKENQVDTDEEAEKSKEITSDKSAQVDKKPTSKPKADKKTKKASSSSSSSESKESAESNKVGNGKCKFDVLFVIDASGSLRQRYQKQLELAAQLIDVLGEDSKAGLIKYSGQRQSKVCVPLGSNLTTSEFKSKLVAEPFMGGTTYTDKALDKAFDEINGEGARKGALPVVIVFTDGFSKIDPEASAKKLHDKSIPVFAIGVADGHYINENELRVIASSPAHVYLDTTFQTLKDALNQLSQSC